MTLSAMPNSFGTVEIVTVEPGTVVTDPATEIEYTVENDEAVFGASKVWVTPLIAAKLKQASVT